MPTQPRPTDRCKKPKEAETRTNPGEFGMMDQNEPGAGAPADLAAEGPPAAVHSLFIDSSGASA